MKIFLPLIFAIAILTTQSAMAVDLNWAEFLGRNDMVWNSMPDQWGNGPFTGNGRLGTIFWQNKQGALHFEVSRTDLYDHRRLEGYGPRYARCRLPNGHFELSFGSGLPTGQLRLDLWNAEVKGTMKLGESSWQVRSFTHAREDVIVVELVGTGLAPKLTWHPDSSKSTRKRNVPADYKAYPPQELRKMDGVQVSVQEMPEDKGYHTDGQGVGQYATAWTAKIETGRTVYYLSTRVSHPGTTASTEAVKIVLEAQRKGLADLEKTHRDWWQAYYPKSFLSIPDAKMESYYWIQMYKMASGSRQGGPVLDLLGPWFGKTDWPCIWMNLNIQLTYWPFYMSNHLEEAEPLMELIWGQRDNLAKNTQLNISEAYTIGQATGPDCLEPGKEVGNLPWIMHNLWLHYRSTMDDTVLKDRLFPLMKGSFRYFKKILIKTPDGRWVMPKTGSPEYTKEEIESTSYTLACLRWLASTLIVADARLKAKDPIAAECRELLDKLEPYHVDSATGIMVGKGTPFARSHRHWSHLFMIYPFYEYTWDQPERVELMEKSLNNWTKDTAHFQGYSWLGAASMHAAAGRGDTALQHLNSYFKRSALANTLYVESGGPCIETPLEFARTLQEMMLTSHGDLIRVFPGIPTAWADVVFADLRTEGAFLVSAKREKGQTQWVRVESLAGEPCKIRTGLAGQVMAKGCRPFKLTDLGKGNIEVDLVRGENVLLYLGELPPMLDFKPIAITGPTNPWGGGRKIP